MQVCYKLINYKIVKILDYQDCTAKSHVVDGHQNHNLKVPYYYNAQCLRGQMSVPNFVAIHLAHFSLTKQSYYPSSKATSLAKNTHEVL